MDEAAKEIERLRNELAFHRKTMANIQAVNAFQEMMPPLPFPTITDEERKAIAECAAACENAAQYGIAEDARRASTLRGLLARTTL